MKLIFCGIIAFYINYCSTLFARSSDSVCIQTPVNVRTDDKSKCFQTYFISLSNYTSQCSLQIKFYTNKYYTNNTLVENSEVDNFMFVATKYDTSSEFSIWSGKGKKNIYNFEFFKTEELELRNFTFAIEYNSCKYVNVKKVYIYVCDGGSCPISLATCKPFAYHTVPYGLNKPTVDTEIRHFISLATNNCTDMCLERIYAVYKHNTIPLPIVLRK